MTEIERWGPESKAARGDRTSNMMMPEGRGHVGFGSLGDIRGLADHVRCSPNSRHGGTFNGDRRFSRQVARWIREAPAAGDS